MSFIIGDGVNRCSWSVEGCRQDVLGPGAHCYYHDKIAAGLITERRLSAWSGTTSAVEPIALPTSLAEEARRWRAAYYAGLTSGPGAA
jgi:hypothetical protein